MSENINLDSLSLRRSAELSNMMGKSINVNLNRSTVNHISYAERLKYNQEAKNVEDLTDTELQEQLIWTKSTIIKLANGELKGKELGEIYSKIESIKGVSDKYYVGQGNQHNERTLLLAMYSIINMLLYALGILEGNLPPNSLGYLPQESVSIARKDEIALEDLRNASITYKIFINDSNAIDLLFDHQFIELFNSISDRINSNRPTLMGRPIGQNPVTRL